MGAKPWNFIIALLWFIFLFWSGIYLFSRGFLLSRISKTDFNECIKLTDEDFKTKEGLERELLKNSSVNYCLPTKSRVILLVIDALKYEFGVYNPDIVNPLPFENKLPIIHEIMTNHPDNSRLYRFIADPPTTTLQRLKGLTTGTLPTFIDVGSNFVTPAINEDNIIDQVKRNNMTSVFMGDDTWTSLFPTGFKRRYSYPSFDIFDLDTVDTKTLRALNRELPETDWDLLIAHFLGVDHCGHRYGPNHSEMSRKLADTDQIIRKIISAMDPNTTLIVIGDHGMTGTGDHGGDSQDELNALFFAYSKGHRFMSLSGQFSGDFDMQQIDLVPILATLLGVPIPYSSLGSIDLKLIPAITVPNLNPLKMLTFHLWQNTKQVHDYYVRYDEENEGTFRTEISEQLNHEFTMLAHRVSTVSTEPAFDSVSTDLRLHMKRVAETCREVWVKFDPYLMQAGILITFFTAACLFIIVYNMKVIALEEYFTLSYLQKVTAGIIIIACTTYAYIGNLTLGIVLGSSIASILGLLFNILDKWPCIAEGMSEQTKFEGLPLRLIYFASIAVFFSNSFVIYEQQILGYLTMSIFFFAVYEMYQLHLKCSQSDNSRLTITSFANSLFVKTLLLGICAVILIRGTFVFFQCREEHGNCGTFKHEEITKTNNTDLNHYNIAVHLFLTLILGVSAQLYSKNNGNLNGFGWNILIAKNGIYWSIAGNIAHLICSFYSPARKLLDVTAWIVYIVCALQLITLIISPLMISTKEIKNDQAPTEDANIFGLPTTYSSVFVTLGGTFGLFLALLLGTRGANGFFMMILAAVILLIIHSIVRHGSSRTLESCFQPTAFMLLGWFLLAHYTFYATGHQATLSQINWHAAFVGRSAKYDHNVIISGILVICNTFGGVIIFGILYPIIQVLVFSINGRYQGLVLKREARLVDVVRKVGNVKYTSVRIAAGDTTDPSGERSYKIDQSGEMICLINEHLFLGSAFKVACQFLFLQGLKMGFSMLACTVLSRHLMVWKIFAPRFIYEGIATIVFSISIFIGYLILVRIHLGVWSLLNSKVKRD